MVFRIKIKIFEIIAKLRAYLQEGAALVFRKQLHISINNWFKIYNNLTKKKKNQNWNWKNKIPLTALKPKQRYKFYCMNCMHHYYTSVRNGTTQEICIDKTTRI